MTDDQKLRLLEQVASDSTEIQKNKFQSLLFILNSIQYNRYLIKDEFISERLQNSNLLLQKIMLNGYSMNMLISGIQIPNIEYKNFVKLRDPSTLNIILRSLLESYLTFHYFNFADTQIENDIRHKIWAYYGLYNRSKINIDTPSLQERSHVVKEHDAHEMSILLDEITGSELYKQLSNEKQKLLNKDLKKNWKIKFCGQSYKSLSYQDLFDNIGLRIKYYKSQYNYLSWSAHTTSILIYQLRNMYDAEWDKTEIHTVLLKACSMIALSTIDLILNDKDYLSSYNLLNQEHKDLINFYSYYYRGNEYTQDKVD
jgi:hypothetical protein